MQYLEDELISYSGTDMYPFHMPGHKREAISFPNPYTIDITEIDGFDNLHHATGILEEAQERAAALYGSKECFYLVNGSTCGLLSAICAATGKRDRVLVARNCHKAVYHAMFLNELQAEYLYPVITEWDLQGQITAEQVEDSLKNNPDIAAVILTSPTYEGIVSDVRGIAEVAHGHRIPLIVDAAHGAHLGFGAGFEENAVKLGADAVIMSLHKTLPSFTQTALLHLCSDRIDREQVKKYLGVFETSSPSYLFMAGMDSCIRMIKEQGEELFLSYRKLLEEFYQNTADLKHLHVMVAEDLKKTEAYGWDDSKIVIFTGTAPMTGEELHTCLRKKYHLQMELVSANYVLAMTSVMDKREGFARLSAALHEIDANVAMTAEGGHAIIKKISFTQRMYTKNPREMQIYQASELPCMEVSFAEAVGKMAADYIYLYPPGIPLIVPGEVITGSFLEKIKECDGMGLTVEGSVDAGLERIKIVYF